MCKSVLFIDIYTTGKILSYASITRSPYSFLSYLMMTIYLSVAKFRNEKYQLSRETVDAVEDKDRLIND